MHVRALRGFHHGLGVRRGQVIEVAPDIGAQLVARGLASEMKDQPNASLPTTTTAPAANGREETKSGVGPFELSQPGGQTGEARQLSSSRPAHQRKTTTSKSAAAARASSRSTARGS